jgi:hypothetical protein
VEQQAEQHQVEQQAEQHQVEQQAEQPGALCCGDFVRDDLLRFQGTHREDGEPGEGFPDLASCSLPQPY